MNERINQLAEQAWKEILDETNIDSDISTMFSADEVVAFERKFAELIVREMLVTCEAHAMDLESQPTDPLLEAYEDGVVNGIYEATVAIKEHFGVEQ